MRDQFVDGKVLARIVKDIQILLGVEEDEKINVETLSLWDDKQGSVSYGVNYGGNEEA